MVARQMELVLEGCLSRMLVSRSQADVNTAQRLAEKAILRFAQCRQGWRAHLTVLCSPYEKQAVNALSLFV